MQKAVKVFRIFRFYTIFAPSKQRGEKIILI